MTLGKKLIGGGIAGLALLGVAGTGILPHPAASQMVPALPPPSKPAGGAASGASGASRTTIQGAGNAAVETKTVKVSEPITFETKIENDPALPNGQSRVSSAGANGERIVTYRVTYQDGKEIRRENIGAEVTKQPVAHVTVVGSKDVAAGSTTPPAATPEQPARPAPRPGSNPVRSAETGQTP